MLDGLSGKGDAVTTLLTRRAPQHTAFDAHPHLHTHSMRSLMSLPLWHHWQEMQGSGGFNCNGAHCALARWSCSCSPRQSLLKMIFQRGLTHPFAAACFPCLCR